MTKLCLYNILRCFAYGKELGFVMPTKIPRISRELNNKNKQDPPVVGMGEGPQISNIFYKNIEK